jgi:GT2 family glycosyltransferase
MKASSATTRSDQELTLETAEETIQQLVTRVATLERLLLASASSASPDPAGEGDHEAILALRDSVQSVIGPSKTCAVVSRGDDRLLLLGERPGWHFPRLDNGSYTGYYPGDDEAAIAHLEYVRACGADVLVFPDTQLWWFDHYRSFGTHLDRNYSRIIDESHCRAYSLAERRSASEDPLSSLRAAMQRVEEDWGRPPTLLDLTESGIENDLDHVLSLQAPGVASALPFVEGTVDFVVVPDGEPESMAEAQRIAGEAVCVQPKSERSDASPAALRIEWQRKAARRHPTVSVIIPTYNGASYLRGCLPSLRDTVPRDLDVEIVVADDCSIDETVELLEDWKQTDDRVRVHRSSANRGFIDTCNAAAKSASGDLLVFLNNDTVTLDGWLSALLRTFHHVDDAGVVGGKLIFPDGRLQEAGGVMFRDATGANFGKWDPKPAGPLYSYLRDVDYCSGALLATPRALFEDVGGFDTKFRPAYYEDSDYCFQVRKRGLRVVYQPESAIVHLEGGTSGTDLTVGPKRSQARNRKRFQEKWRSELAGRPKPPTQYDLVTWYQLAYAAEGVR